MIELRWIVLDETTTESYKLQYRYLIEENRLSTSGVIGLPICTSEWSDWFDVPKVIVSKEEEDWRIKQHGKLDAAMSCLNSHKKYPDRDGESYGYKIELAIRLLNEAWEMEKVHDPNKDPNKIERWR